jgi:predicted ArsR family transcriptional regulator
MSRPDACVSVQPPIQSATLRVMTSAASIREQVFDCIAFSDGLTPDEVARRLEISVLTVRPRCSELVRRGRLVDNGVRRANASGRLAKVLVVSSGERTPVVAA